MLGEDQTYDTDVFETLVQWRENEFQQNITDVQIILKIKKTIDILKSITEFEEALFTGVSHWLIPGTC